MTRRTLKETAALECFAQLARFVDDRDLTKSEAVPCMGAGRGVRARVALRDARGARRVYTGC